MKKPAKKADWKTLDPPKARATLGYVYVFDDSDAERLQDGFIPQAMEDKWFVYFENGWLYLHRSWTGALIYWLKLDGCPVGVRVVESWVSREAEQYRETDILYDRQLLDFLLRAMILEQKIEFPIRQKDAASDLPGLYQHHLVGRGYPEKNRADEKSSGDHFA